MLELIKAKITDDDILKFLDISISSCEMLKSKIDDILDYANLEANNLVPKSESFNLRKLMIDIENLVEYQYDKNRTKFNIYISEKVPEFIVHDEKRIKQIMLNLVYNALKYTEQGFVNVVIDCSYPPRKLESVLTKLKRKPNYLCNLHFYVSDSGCGIDKKLRLNLYKMFNDFDINESANLTKSSKLMGIGLTFCQKMLNCMGSELEMTTVPKIGSTFKFILKSNYIKGQGDYSPEVIRQVNTPGGKSSLSYVVQKSLSFNESTGSASVSKGLRKMQTSIKDTSIIVKDSKMTNLSTIKEQRKISQNTLNPDIEKHIQQLKCSNFALFSDRNIKMIREESKDFEESVSKQSEDLYQIKREYSSFADYSDISPNVYSEGNRDKSIVPTFEATVGKGWEYNSKTIRPNEQLKIDLRNCVSRENDSQIIGQETKLRNQRLHKQPTPKNELVGEAHSERARSKSKFANLKTKDLKGGNLRSFQRAVSVFYNPEISDFVKPATKNENEMISKIIHKNDSLSISDMDESNFCRIYSNCKFRQNSLKLLPLKEIERDCGCPTVLIVDDQIINRLILNEFGMKLGIKSDEAENGKIALQKYKEKLKLK
jgi:CheY-like chemotaxis protein